MLFTVWLVCCLFTTSSYGRTLKIGFHNYDPVITYESSIRMAFEHINATIISQNESLGISTFDIEIISFVKTSDFVRLNELHNCMSYFDGRIGNEVAFTHALSD
eukprot:TRINITY_DN9675_c0_g1_i1.p1 TRINITY_DN9675_c0_g1~~TRINITY_DN9675_c0_g1_i1.p1  ORF type:complete len:104 (+),score=3.18 TRINITY_DN9675_c0_g1_i1:426-737(+)